MMDDNTANETASRLYSATTALLGIFDDNTGTRAISQEDVRRILSMPAGKLSIASVETTGDDRALNFALGLKENLFPPIPDQVTVTGAILAIYYSGDMTTEEYQVICNKLLGNYPDDIQTTVSLSPDKSVADSFKGTLLVSWEKGL